MAQGFELLGTAGGMTLFPVEDGAGGDSLAVGYLSRNGKRVAFLKGVFRPRVLCEDRAGDTLWLASYSGVLSVPLSSLSVSPGAVE